MKTDLTDKVALITGGAGTIGSATAKLLAQNGAFVYINDINGNAGEKLEKTILKAGGKARFIPGSILNEADIRDFVQTALSKHKQIDILINNAGYNVDAEARKPVSDYRQEDWDKVINLCLDGMYGCCKYVLPNMLQNGGGRVVNIASVVGWRAPLKFQSPYAAAKAGIINITRTMAIEYGCHNINFNSVIPGSIMNSQIRTVVYGTEQKQQSMLSHLPLGRSGEPEDIGNAVLFLVSPEARYITGCCINVDGGWASGYALK